MNILVIEASTSSAKAMLYHGKTDTYEVHQIKYPASVSDVATQDIQGVMDTVYACAKELMSRTTADVDIIAMASVWHSYLLLDEKGDPVTKVKTWADTRAARTAGKYKNDPTVRQDFYQRTGCNIHSKYPCWKWVHDRRTLDLPEHVRISSVPEYLFETLTGERAVSRSVASGTGFLNIHTLAWDREVLDFCGLSGDQLSDLREYDHCGRLSRSAAGKMGLSEGMPVVIPGADGALNQIGEGALRDGVMTMSVGTSAAIRLAAPEPVLPREPATWCYYAGGGMRLVGAATASGGNCVDWFTRKVLRSSLDFDELEKALTGVDIGKAPLFLPFLHGEQSPGWDDTRLGVYCGLSGDDDIFSMYYALLEGVLFNLYHCYTYLSELMERPKEIRLSGGIVNSPYWTRMAADIFGIPIAVSAVEHSPMMGALAIAKMVTDEIEAVTGYANETSRVIHPRDENRDVYGKRYARYRHCYDSTGSNG